MTGEEMSRRTIDTVTAEIVAIRGYAQRIALEAAIEIGRRLVEAKGMLEHGAWGVWLKERVEFSQVTATRYMRLFEEYADRQQSLFGAETNLSTLKNLSVSNALRLLAIPEDEREEFVEKHDVENLSARKMDALMKELEREKDGRRIALRELEEAREAAAELQGERDAALRRAKEAENRPIEVAVEKADPAEMKKAVDAALSEAQNGWQKEKTAMEKKLAAAEKKWNEQRAKAESAEKAAREADEKLKAVREEQVQSAGQEQRRLEQEVETLKKKLAMSDSAVTAFRTLFEQGQDIFNRMLSAVEQVTDEATKKRLCAAARSLAESVGKKVETLEHREIKEET